MQARTTCQTCDSLLVLTHEEGRWFLRCPKDGGFVNVKPGEHVLPASYADDCQQRAANPKAFDLTGEQGNVYEAAARRKRAYLQASTAAPAADAS